MIQCPSAWTKATRAGDRPCEWTTRRSQISAATSDAFSASATIGALTERLQIRHHATVQLVDRLQQRGMVRRRRAETDRRGVVVELTSEASPSCVSLRCIRWPSSERGARPGLPLTRVIELNGGRPRPTPRGRKR